MIEGIWTKNLGKTQLLVDFFKAFNFIYRGKIEQILLVYSPPKETVTAIMMLCKIPKAMVHSPDEDTNFFDIVTEAMQGDTLAPYLFILCLDYVLQTSIELMR